MKITTQEIRKTNSVLDKILEEYKEKGRRKRDWRTYEQQVAHRIKTAIRNLEPVIEEGISSIEFANEENRGRKPKLDLKQKVSLLLLKRLMDKSNRDMSTMLAVFSALSEMDVSYKTVERLYSDEKVQLVLHNIHQIILRKKGVKDVDCSGDGTGYGLSVKDHYATEARKKKDKVKEGDGKRKHLLSFALMDLDTRMYVGWGTSFRSEKDAANKAFSMAKDSVTLNSARFDKYFSNQKDVKHLVKEFGDVTFYLLPKKNATVRGPWEWKRMLHSFVNDTQNYLKEYYRRNQSESGFAEDKRRFGQSMPQRRKDRVNTAQFCVHIWHNLFWLE